MKNESAVIQPEVLEKVSFDFPLDIRKQIEEGGEFHIVGYAATSDLDLQDDVITDEALKESSVDLLKNSTVLLNHDIKQPIGKVTKAEFDQKGLLIDVLISKTEPDVIQKIKEGVLNKFSIRGQVLEREKKFIPELDKVVNVIKRMSLVEVSLVSVPANPEAKAIGWYIKKALDESDLKPQGGKSMPEKDDLEKIPDQEPEKPAQEPQPPAPAPADKPAEESAPSDTKTVEEAAKPEPKPEEVLKQSGMTAHLDLIWSLLDRMIGMGGDSGPLAVQTKALLKWMTGDTTFQVPSSGSMSKSAVQPALSKDETNQFIAQEVKKQLNSALKDVSVIRKGLVQKEEESSEIKKKFEELSLEQKLKVALALNGQH